MSQRAGSAEVEAVEPGADGARALRPDVLAETPPEHGAAEVGPPAKVAGGLTAVLKAMEHAVGKMGPIRATQALLRVNQKGGFDCQSCAWPDADGEREAAAFCENGAKAVADEGMEAGVTPGFFAEHSVAELSGESDHWLNKQGRIAHPVVLRAGATHYAPISWDEAFQLIAAELNALASPDEAVFYTSGRTSNEAAFLYQLFVRQLGTNNLPDCSNMCHESSGTALNETIGVGKGTVTLEDFERTPLILILGQNPGTNHPRMLTALQKAKRRGAKILTLNPLPEAGLLRFKHPQELSGTLGSGTPLTDLFLPVRINGDMAALKGIMKELLAEEAKRPGQVLDRAFIDAKTEGFASFAQALESVSWEEIERDSGLSREEIRQAAEMVLAADRFIVCWAMGLTQHPNAVATIQEVVNLALLRGSIGKPGAGVCPVRGHSNVQGDRTVGIYEKMPEWFLAALDKEFRFTAPRKPGLDTVDSIRAMHAGQAKIFFALGGNFLSATPDTAFTAEALARCRLTVHVSTKLNRSHLVPGRQALILPCLGRSEIDRQASGPQLVSTENSMGVVQGSQGELEPASEHLLSEVAIVARLAEATLGKRSAVDWRGLAGNYDRIRDHLSRVVPGFDAYNERVRQPGGFYLPNAVRDSCTFRTPSGRARFTTHALPARELAPDQLVMMTIRSHDQFNTTVYGLDDRYRGIYGGRRVVFLNAEDLRERGFNAGDAVDLVSHFRGEKRRAERFTIVPYSIPRGCAATYFPEANVLVPLDSVAEKSNTPASKYVVISLERPATSPGAASA